MLPVLIVGAGPVGLLLAHLLSELNVPVILIDRHAEPLTIPKAHVLASRSLEILRQYGVSVAEIRSQGTRREHSRWIRFNTDLAGKEFGVLPFDNQDVEVLGISPEILHSLPQPDLQRILGKLLERKGKADVRRGWTWLSSSQTDDEVVSTIVNTYTGEQQTIRSSLIMACDGTNSRVRTAVSIDLDEEDGLQMMSLHFSANLRPIVQDRTAMLYWIMDPAVQGVIIAYDLAGNLVLLHQFDPDIHPMSSFTPERCGQIIRTALGCDVPFDFLSAVPWKMKSQLAKEYSRGRVILCGDAAHSFPPTGGLGLNSGIADVHNLAWKIAGHYRDPTHSPLPSVLETYESERRPVGRRNASRAMLYGAKVFDLLKALGLIDPDPIVARQIMHDRLEDPAWDERIAAMVEEQREQFSSNNLHMGFVYEPEWHFTNGSDFEPAFRRGARLSHAWITVSEGRERELLGPLVEPVDLDYVRGELSEEALASWRYSILDLIPIDSYVFFYRDVVSINGDSADMGWDGIAEHVPASSNTRVRALRIGHDFAWADTAAGQAWEKAYGLDRGGAVLIRPDQYVEAVLQSPRDVNVVSSGLGRSLLDCR